MDLGKAVKIQIKLNSNTAHDPLTTAMEQYRQACDFVSQYIFDHDFPLGVFKLQGVLYQELRSQFRLKAQMAISVLRTVTARYKAVRTQLKQKPYRYQDEQGKWQKQTKDLTWLWYPIRFRRPQLDLVRGRDWSIRQDGSISLNTLDRRITVWPVLTHWTDYFDGTWKLGTAKVLTSGGKWYLHIGATQVVADYDQAQTAHVVGVDRGLRFLAAAFDEAGTTKYLSGTRALNKRQRYKKLRTRLQFKGTKSAKRVLKRINQRENRWMSNENHRLAKTLVDRYGTNTLFVLEDLTGIRFATEQVPKDRRYEQVSWPFYQLEQFLTYNAAAVGSHVLKVAPDYTSQRCPQCGTIDKRQRDREHHEYRCVCGFVANDDQAAAMNIQQLGTRWLAGTAKPRYTRKQAG
ncbi:transposase [Schleiferilactobacillus harbinensis]|jgi:IS605 OrfB family transposase|uniref:transposase n=1 Tax=Schleiferilactobacillus harbinensis TaxID=304207 RepID=UPI00242FC002|nr:transposase [Schleiferilactobacillus harbinensis]MCI1686731.1 RNA-guided endonuclease TnpB family protein [Schleiferilactobacillus harbinensis]MCI1784013.1 RNA-guided endonuclease TnpB family protein [Schleiferilactobacillus harbinensis]MCI1849550.1 RNA-guided endonuclease TnpB family protein [Schleiferilactobacillus harbinensis]